MPRNMIIHSRINALLLLTLLVSSCGDKKEKSGSTDAYQESRESMESIEKKNPARFLSVTGKDHKNILGQTVVKGTIRNKASVVTYKDIDIKLRFYSKTGALLEEDHEVIFESIAPGGEEDFKTKYFAPKGTDSVALKVISAKY